MNENKNVSKSKTRSRRANSKPARNKQFGKEMSDKEYKQVMKSDRTTGSNDVSWYANSPEMLRASASISFNTPLGARNPLSRDNYAVPGVCTLRWNPCVKYDAVNQAANSMYSFVVHANSRNYSYDPADLMMLVLAGASVFSMLAHGVRAYGTMRKFNGLDMYTPRVLVESMGFEYEDLRNNLAKMWFDLNELISKVTQIWIPNTMPILQRWFWMNTNIYRDESSVKSQYYLFVPDCYYELEETQVPTGTKLSHHTWPESGATWAKYLDVMNSMINKLLASEDRGIIFGDLLKAYGADKLYAVRPIDSDFAIEPVYDREVLSQIENASITDLKAGDITQTEDGKIRQGGVYDTVARWNDVCIFRPDHEVLNFHQLESPTAEQIMVATRLKALGTRQIGESTATDGTVSKEYVPYTAGTEFIRTAFMYCWDYSSGAPVPVKIGFSPYSWNKLFSAKYMAVYDAFDWRPFMYTFDTLDASTTGVSAEAWYGSNPRVIGDYDNYTFITANELKKMHTAAIYSEFGIPQF